MELWVSVAGAEEVAAPATESCKPNPFSAARAPVSEAYCWLIVGLLRGSGHRRGYLLPLRPLRLEFLRRRLEKERWRWWCCWRRRRRSSGRWGWLQDLSFIFVKIAAFSRHLICPKFQEKSREKFCGKSHKSSKDLWEKQNRIKKTKVSKTKYDEIGK